MRPLALLLIGVVVLPAVARGADRAEPVPPKIKNFLEQCERSRKAAIVNSEESLRKLRSGQVKTRGVAGRIKALEADLERLQAKKTLIIPTLDFLPSKGDIGRLPGIGGHVNQVLDAKSMVVTCYFSDPVVVVRNTRPTLQKITRPVTFLVRGVSTAEVHVGMDLELSQVFEVIETRKDPAAKTLPMPTIEPFDLQQVEPYRQKS